VRIVIIVAGSHRGNAPKICFSAESNLILHGAVLLLTYVHVHVCRHICTYQGGIHIFKQKIQSRVNFGGSLQWKMLAFLWPFDLHIWYILVYFVPIWYIFTANRYIYPIVQRKICQCQTLTNVAEVRYFITFEKFWKITCLERFPFCSCRDKPSRLKKLQPHKKNWVAYQQNFTLLVAFRLSNLLGKVNSQFFKIQQRAAVSPYLHHLQLKHWKIDIFNLQLNWTKKYSP
jgi:hypothetical protein